MPTSRVDIADYDQSAYDYRKYWKHRQYDDLVERSALEQLLPTGGEHLLDIGGGFGRVIETYKPRYKHATIVDYSDQQLRNAQAKLETLNVQNISTVKGNIYALPFENNTFDCALMLRVIHHLSRPSLALHEIARILQPDSTLILQFANKIHLKNRLRSVFSRNKTIIDKKPLNLSAKGIFYQFHPEYIKEKLKENDFEIQKVLSVSSLRIPLLYRYLPTNFLLILERIIQPISTRFLLGPSVFIVARKR